MRTVKITKLPWYFEKKKLFCYFWYLLTSTYQKILFFFQLFHGACINGLREIQSNLYLGRTLLWKLQVITAKTLYTVLKKIVFKWQMSQMMFQNGPHAHLTITMPYEGPMHFVPVTNRGMVADICWTPFYKFENAPFGSQWCHKDFSWWFLPSIILIL